MIRIGLFMYDHLGKRAQPAGFDRFAFRLEFGS